ncbi:MAG: ATP-binding cassette domain-containing protein [Pseudomonadota bacterium]
MTGFSLEIPEGAIVTIVGPSGAGKTTIARSLARFWDVSSGAIRIGGVDLSDMSPPVLAENMSFVLQDVFLFTRSVAGNIRICRPTASDLAG